MRGHTISESVTLVTETCCTCGVLFAMSSTFKQQRISDHQNFYCPAGHAQHYTGKSEAEKERERAARLERQLSDARTTTTHLRDQLESTQRSLSATKGVLTKTRKRIGNGACPCCKRYFANVEAHMQNKHPGYAQSASS